MRTAPYLIASMASLMIVGCASKRRPAAPREVCTPPAAGHGQPVSLRAQETGMWCWAASGEMIMDFLGTDVTQCDQANRRFGMADCCEQPAPSICVDGGWPEFGRYGFTYRTTSYAPLTWEQIKEQVYCKEKPFAFTWLYDGDTPSGHMMVVSGYRRLDGVNYVTVQDPWPPQIGATKTMTYDAYVEGAGYSHWHDYYDVARQGQ